MNLLGQKMRLIPEIPFFLEDVGEQLYSVDRMMTKLRRVGKLEQVKGVILGSFTSMGNTNDYFSESVEELVLSYLPTHIPTATGADADTIRKTFH